MDNIYTKKRPALIISLITLLVIAVAVALVVGLSGRSNTATTQQQLAQQQKDLANSAYADPILKYLPYGGAGYRIDPIVKIINGKQVFTLSVSVILSGSDYRLSPADLQSAIDSRKQSALDYIRSIGFDPGKYNIEYDVPAH